MNVIGMSCCMPRGLGKFVRTLILAKMTFHLTRPSTGLGVGILLGLVGHDLPKFEAQIGLQQSGRKLDFHFKRFQVLEIGQVPGPATSSARCFPSIYGVK